MPLRLYLTLFSVSTGTYYHLQYSSCSSRTFTSLASLPWHPDQHLSKFHQMRSRRPSLQQLVSVVLLQVQSFIGGRPVTCRHTGQRGWQHNGLRPTTVASLRLTSSSVINVSIWSRFHDTLLHVVRRRHTFSSSPFSDVFKLVNSLAASNSFGMLQNCLV